MRLREILDLTPHGPDTFMGAGPQYPWGGLYGGQIVAQALRATCETIEPGYAVHSLRAYFIRRGDHDEPVRYEVDRTRDGRSFCTRRIIARQAIGAILNLEASFQRPEPSVDLSPVATTPGIVGPDSLPNSSWSPIFERAVVPAGEGESARGGDGRVRAWLRMAEALGEDPLLNACGFSYLSDDMPTDSIVRAHPISELPEEVLYQRLFTASLDHTIWFHRPFQPVEWHLHDFSCHRFVGGRGLSIGHVFDRAGVHVATVAQELLMRDTAERTA